MKVSNVNLNIDPQQATSQKEEADAASFQDALDKAVASGDKEQLKKVAQQFESIFMHMMLKSMRSTVGDGGLTEKSHAREIFESMFDQELADTMAESGDLGIADLIYKQMEKYVSAASEEDDDEEEHTGLDLKG